MTAFDDLVHDICSAQDDVTHLNEMGAVFESDTRKAKEARAAAIERLRERYDGLAAACKAADNYLDFSKADYEVQCVGYNHVKALLRAAIAKAQEAP